MLEGYKTYIVMFVGIVGVAGAFLMGEIDLANAINQVVLLLGLGGLRAGVASSK